MAKKKPANEADPTAVEQPEAKDEWFAEDVDEITMRNRGTVGQTVFEPGTPLAEVRLARGVTLAQLCAAIRQGKAGE